MLLCGVHGVRSGMYTYMQHVHLNLLREISIILTSIPALLWIWTRERGLTYTVHAPRSSTSSTESQSSSYRPGIQDSEQIREQLQYFL